MEDIRRKQKRRLLIPSLIALIGSLVLIATLFVPFASAPDEYRELLPFVPEEVLDEAEVSDIQLIELIDVSLFDVGRILFKVGNLYWNQEEMIILMMFFSVYILPSLLTVLFAALRKPIATIIFCLSTFGVFITTFYHMHFGSSDLISDSEYQWSYAPYVCCVGAALVLVGAIILLVLKRKNKKELKALDQQQKEKYEASL